MAPSPLDAAGLPGVSGGAVDGAAARLGGPPTAGCRPPIWRCMWCCPRSMAASSPASSASRRRAGATPTCNFRALPIAPMPARVAAVVDRVAGWHRLAATAPADRRLALVLSTYPGQAHQLAHAVGLDALASAEAILATWRMPAMRWRRATGLGRALTDERLDWPLADYRAALAHLPEPLHAALCAAWGRPRPIRPVTMAPSASRALRRGDCAGRAATRTRRGRGAR